MRNFMRNTNWTMIGIALCVIAVLLYLIMQSDFMGKKGGGPESEVATSMDIGEEEFEGNPYEEWQEDLSPDENAPMSESEPMMS